MAEFTQYPSSQNGLMFLESENAFVLDPGARADIVLSGIEPDCGPLRIAPADSDIVQCFDVVAPPSVDGLARRVSLARIGIGQTTLEATDTSSGRPVATTAITVGFSPGVMQPAAAVPLHGSVPVAFGGAAVVRIPVPESNGLCIEFRPRGRVPRSGSTSTLFIQDLAGKRQLRLDYGKNPVSNTIDYHWNQKGVFQTFGITDHTTVGPSGAAAYKAARYFRYGGRVLVVVGAVADAYSIVVADQPLRQATKVVAGWAGAWVGCKLVGAGGAWVGTAATPGLGTAIGGVAGCIVGGFIGYEGASMAAGRLYDWGSARFAPLPELPAAP